MLYPNIQKDEAFGSYYTVQGEGILFCGSRLLSVYCFILCPEEEQEFNAQGYLKHDLRVVIPSLVGAQ